MKTGSGNLSCPSPAKAVQGKAQIPIIDSWQEANMEGKNENRIKTLLSDVDEEFKQLDNLHRAKFAIEQISLWQRKFNETKVRG